MDLMLAFGRDAKVNAILGHIGTEALNLFFR
jgi:hypothetical protein